MQLTEEQAEAYEQELESLSEKEILLEMLVELKAIRFGLQTGDFGTTPGENTESEPVYQCKQCGKGVKEDGREQHLVEQHNAPRGLGVSEEFEQ